MIRRVRCHFGEQMYGGSMKEGEAGRLASCEKEADL